MLHPVEEQDESVPIRPSRRRCNQGTSATELERPRSFTGLLENPRATRKQHHEGHSDRPPSCLRPHVVTGVINLHLESTQVKDALPKSIDAELHDLKPGDWIVVKDLRRKNWRARRVNKALSELGSILHHEHLILQLIPEAQHISP
ncbi:unnamed protein product [Pleuronectes platessa]|uniref:Uncharacterized protein n=1 Tax=Pleuronectes platessa TaxID=8262 RepID=A0A9N7YH64_PLEPL|nr:unnamed protein product [Pleuronectes platessa]